MQACSTFVCALKQDPMQADLSRAAYVSCCISVLFFQRPFLVNEDLMRPGPVPWRCARYREESNRMGVAHHHVSLTIMCCLPSCVAHHHVSLTIMSCCGREEIPKSHALTSENRHDRVAKLDLSLSFCLCLSNNNVPCVHCLGGFQLCDGASPEERQRWRLTKASDYHYLSQSSCYELSGVDNAEEYKAS
eukprot:1159492-Pelagomonas_calceolata.AAC.5